MSKLIALIVTAFVDMIGGVMIVPLLPFYATRLGANGTVVGVLVAAFSVAQLVSAPAWGRLSDRRGRRPTLLAGLAVSVVGYLLFAGADALGILFLSRVVQGFGGGTIGAINAYVADVSEPKARAKAIGWLTAATSLGAVVGPVLGSLAAQAWGRSAPGLAAAALCVANLVFAAVALRETREAPRTGEHRVARPTSTRSALLEVLRRPTAPAPRLIWIYSVGIGAFYGMVAVFPLYLARMFGVTEATIGYFVMFFGAVGVIVRLGILGRLVAWLGEARLSRVGLVLLAAGMATFPLPRHLVPLFFTMLLMPLGTALTFPGVTALLSRVVPSSERGLYLGVQQSFGGVARVALPVWAGFAFDRFGSASPFWSGAALAALGLVLAAGIATPVDEPATTPATTPAGVGAAAGASGERVVLAQEAALPSVPAQPAPSSQG